MSHTLPIPFSFGSKSIAYLTENEPENLVIFVHGFKGSPIKTWGDFASLGCTHPDFKTSDLIFYGYDSLNEQASNHGAKFYTCIDKIIEKGVDSFTSFKRSLNINYQQIIIVGHSLGSIVVRRSLLYAKQNNKTWLEKCKMVLFAPAHNGARGKEALASLLGMWIFAIHFKYPIIEDLMPDSIIIKELTRDSEYYINRNEGDFCKAFKVVWASSERIVHNGNFCSDPAPETLDNTTHKTVCKPIKSNFVLPFEILKQAL